MNSIIELLLVKPARNFLAWVTKHWLIAGVFALVFWFLPPLGVVLYALSSKALGENIGKLFIETRWARIALTLALAVLVPPVGFVLTLWLLLDFFKPDDRITTRSIEEIAAQVKQGIAGLFGKFKRTPDEPAPVSVEAVPADAPSTPPPNPVVGGDVEFNPVIGLDWWDDFGGVT